MPSSPCQRHRCVLNWGTLAVKFYIDRGSRGSTKQTDKRHGTQRYTFATSKVVGLLIHLTSERNLAGTFAKCVVATSDKIILDLNLKDRGEVTKEGRKRGQCRVNGRESLPHQKSPSPSFHFFSSPLTLSLLIGRHRTTQMHFYYAAAPNLPR